MAAAKAKAAAAVASRDVVMDIHFLPDLVRVLVWSFCLKALGGFANIQYLLTSPFNEKPPATKSQGACFSGTLFRRANG
jgi:hypothetical protein